MNPFITHRKNNEKLNSIKISDLETKNIKHDKLLIETLAKTEYKDIGGLQEYFQEKIHCSLVDEYKDGLESDNIRNIVLKASINKLQQNYKINAELILSSNKVAFEDFMTLLDEKIEDGLDLGIRPFNLLLKKANGKEQVIMVIEKYKHYFTELDQIFFQTVIKRVPELKDNYELLDTYLPKHAKLNIATINTMLFRTEDPEEKEMILRKYAVKKEYNIKTINELLKNVNNLDEGLNLIYSHSLDDEITTNTINTLLLKTRGPRDIEKVLNLKPDNITFNLNTLSALLYKIRNFEDIKDYLVLLDDEIKEKIKDKERFCKNFFLKKIASKFGFETEELYNEINKILRETNIDEINEENWTNFI